jgi:hypothetical protein
MAGVSWNVIGKNTRSLCGTHSNDLFCLSIYLAGKKNKDIDGYFFLTFNAVFHIFNSHQVRSSIPKSKKIYIAKETLT